MPRSGDADVQKYQGMMFRQSWLNDVDTDSLTLAKHQQSSNSNTRPSSKKAPKDRTPQTPALAKQTQDKMKEKECNGNGMVVA